MPPVSGNSNDWLWLSTTADVVGLIGFVVTVASALYARSAATQAREAARNAKLSMLRLDFVAQVAAVIRDIDDIGRMHREGTWPQLPSRYAAARRVLIEIRACEGSSLAKADRTILQSAVTQFTWMEEQVESYIASQKLAEKTPATPPDSAQLNRIISREADNLTRLLSRLRTGSEAL